MLRVRSFQNCKIAALAFSLLVISRATAAGADGLPSRKEIASVMRRVNAWQVANPAMKADDRNWERGTFYTGVMAAWKATGDKSYFDEAMAWGKQHEWQVGTEPYGANRLFCVQTWAELYLREHDQKMIQPAISWLDTRDPRSPAGGQTRWYLEGSRAYVDSLYGASALAMLARATGDSRYYDIMHRFFDDVTAELFDKEAGLYYRDNRFIGQLTPNGKKIFWARGNGWVFAGIARILEYLPQNDRHRPHYVEIYRRMASELVKRQSSDGLWRVSLDDPEILPDPETSGTGFFCYGLAWGVNHGVLDRKQYHQPIVKAFRGLLRSVSPEGKVQWGQLVDDQPHAAERESTHEYVAAIFLLAASEVYKLKQ
jgi:rhamnogalacturonyl hydrolase YesR